jgi:hypothetical protein
MALLLPKAAAAAGRARGWLDRQGGAVLAFVLEKFLEFTEIFVLLCETEHSS